MFEIFNGMHRYDPDAKNNNQTSLYAAKPKPQNLDLDNIKLIAPLKIGTSDDSV